MSKTLKTFTIFAVFMLLGFTLYNQKDPDPQKLDGTSISSSMEILTNQAPSNHDRPSPLVPPLWTESFDNATFPPTGWLNLQESGTGLWARATSTTYPSGFIPHSGAGLARFNSFTYSTGTSASLISAVFSLTAGQAKLGFWMIRDDGYNTSADKVDFMINTTASSTGATLLLTINRAKGLAPVETGANGWYYYEYTIPASFNTATNYIIMKATSAYGNDIYVDDVSVNPLLLHDVGTQSVDVSTPQAPGTIVPKATVKNFGSSVETFPVTMTITPGGYTSTMNVTSLAAGSTSQVTFANWVAANGTYTVKVYTQAATDLDRTNDTLSKTVLISSLVWTTGAVFPAPLADLGHGQGYSRNDTGWVFVIGGEIGQTNVRSYNTRTDTWTSVAPLPTGKDRGGSARLVDSLYMIGGANASNVYTNDMFRYDIRGNAWVSRAPLPVNLGWSDGAGYQDSLIYVAGGYTGTATVNTVYLYNAKSNTWRTATPLPAIRFGGGMAISGDTLVYVGGVDGSLVQNTTYRGVISQADRSVITWTTGTPMPTGMFRIDAHSWGNRGIILTGGSSGTAFTSVSNACLTYSPGANVWTTLPNKITPWTAGQSGTVSLGGGMWKIVCASGYGGTAQINNVEMFSDTLAIVGVNPGNNTVPEEYSLSQNYPNPFNPTTKIDYNIRSNGVVTLKIYSVLGEEVATIVDGFKSAGKYTVDFNASHISSGIYFYTLRSGDFTATKKMILIK